MNAAARLADRIDVQANDFTARIELLQNRLGPVVGIIVPEFGADYRSVANVIVHLTGHEIPGARAEVEGIGDYDDVELASLCVTR